LNNEINLLARILKGSKLVIKITHVIFFQWANDFGVANPVESIPNLPRTLYKTFHFKAGTNENI
jgi:hypothetical protein